MKPLEKLLLKFSSPPDPSHIRWANTDPLANLRREFPNLGDRVRGARVIDYGCGLGFQAAALGEEFGCDVVGIDSNPRIIRNAKERHPGVRFVTEEDPAWRGSFDVVISHDSFEHFPDPAGTLGRMLALLRPRGVALITFGPPWYAPHGSHMAFCRLPWVNLLFPERVVMAVRARFRDDGARRYTEVESGLNKMTVARFRRIIDASGAIVRDYRVRVVRGLTWLGRVPLLRELFINHVTATLQVRDPPACHSPPRPREF